MEPTCALVTADRGLLISNNKRAVTTGELGSTGAGVGLDITHEQQCGQVRVSYADSLFSWFEQSLSKDCNTWASVLLTMLTMECPQQCSVRAGLRVNLDANRLLITPSKIQNINLLKKMHPIIVDMLKRISSM